MSGHWVTAVISVDDGDENDIDLTFECDEAADADCQWTSDCDCESWFIERDAVGVFHRTYNEDPDDGSEIRHDMHLNQDSCTLKPWWHEGGEWSFAEDWGLIRPGRHEIKAVWADAVSFDYVANPEETP